VLERYDVKEVVTGPQSAKTVTFAAWQRDIEEKGIPCHTAKTGEWIALGRGATLQFLWPPDDASLAKSDDTNDDSVVLKLTWGRASFLLTGDLEAAGENALLQSGVDPQATVLKVAHHGSAYSTSESLLRAVRPLVAVISVGEDNRFGHPSPATLERLDDTIVYRTDQQGEVSLSTDGERLWISTERAPPELPTP